MRKIIIILMVLVTVSCDKVDDMSLNGQTYSQRYSVQESGGMWFKWNTVRIMYVDRRHYKHTGIQRIYDRTYNYTYKNGILTIDGLKVLSTSIGYGNPEKIFIYRNNEVGYAEFHRTH